jgi:hypothetical protein
VLYLNADALVVGEVEERSDLPFDFAAVRGARGGRSAVLATDERVGCPLTRAP